MPPTKTRKRLIVPQQILAIGEDLCANVLVERNVPMRTLTLGALAGKNIHQLGPAGTAKSKMLRAFASRIIGARYFGKAVHAQMPADALLGGYDMPRFAKTGEFARASEHYLPNAHIGNIDEITRANGPTLDALLPILNSEERMAEQNGGMAVTPLMFIITASNYMPDTDDAHLGAFVDRITIMQWIDYVRSDESFTKMAMNRHRARVAAIDIEKPLDAPNPGDPTVTLEQFQQAQREVKLVNPTHEFLTALALIRRQAKDEGLLVSDRRWMEAIDICQASAWLADRDHLITEDLVAMEDCLWRERDQRPLAHKLILPHHGRFERAAVEHRQEMQAPMAIIDQITPAVESTPPTELIDQDVMKQALSAARSLGAVHHRVAKLLEEANAEKRDAAGLRDIDNEIRHTFTWLENNNMPVPKIG